jgi:membrane-associated phospholipid phosphatase
MLDGFSNPIIVTAICDSREGIVRPTDLSSYAVRKPYGFSDPDNVLRWDPWVRNYLLQRELLEGVTFGSDMPSETVTLYVRNQPIVSIKRPSVARFQKEIADVMSFAALRQDRISEILAQVDGQWPFWGALLPVRLEKLKKVQEIITAVVQFAVFVEMHFKQEFACARPAEWSPQIQPMVSTPGHGTFPMGHATQVFAVAVVLCELVGEACADSKGVNQVPDNLAVQMRTLAWRISENRIVAGVHFPVDLYAGLVLGMTLGRCAVAAFKGADPVPLFDGTFDLDANPDTDMATWMREALSYIGQPVRLAARTPTPAANALTTTWQKAVGQFKAGLGLAPDQGA